MYTQPHDCHQSAATATDSAPEVSSESCVDAKILVPASFRKLDLSSSSEDVSVTPEGNEGFRFIDLGILTEIMRTFWCADCRNGHVVMKENFKIEKGIRRTVDSTMHSSEL